MLVERVAGPPTGLGHEVTVEVHRRSWKVVSAASPAAATAGFQMLRF
jgi:hypothetical protein